MRFVINLLIVIVLICGNVIWYNAYTFGSKIGQLKIITSYLNSIQSLAIDFTQIDSNGVFSSGKFLIHKPRRFRINYYAPFPILIVGNKNYVSLYDYDMSQLSRIDVKENVFNFLLENDFKFNGEFQISTINENGLYIDVVFEHLSSNKNCKLIFDKIAQKLHSLQIIEGDHTVTITFENVTVVKRFDDKLFLINNPELFGPPKHLSEIEIEKLYE